MAANRALCSRLSKPHRTSRRAFLTSVAIPIAPLSPSPFALSLRGRYLFGVSGQVPTLLQSPATLSGLAPVTFGEEWLVCVHGGEVCDRHALPLPIAQVFVNGLLSLTWFVRLSPANKYLCGCPRSPDRVR